MGNKNITIAAHQIQENRKSFSSTFQNVPQHWIILSAGGRLQKERFRNDEEIQFLPVMFSHKIDPYMIESVHLNHSVGQHTVIHFKLKDGRNLLYGAGDNVPFNQLPFKTHYETPIFAFQELDIGELTYRPIQKVLCTFKQTLIITMNNEIFCSGITLQGVEMGDSERKFTRVRYDPILEKNIIKAECLHFGIMILTDDNNLHCIQEYSEPRVWNNVKDYISGAYHAYIITCDNQCTKWEIYKSYSQHADSILPCPYEDIQWTAYDRFAGYILTRNNSFYMGGSHSEDYGDGSWTKIELPENIIKQNIIKMVGCHDTVMLLTDQRELYGMGRNQSGNLGVSNSNVHFIRISFDHLSSQLPGVLYDIESCYRTSLALFYDYKEPIIFSKLRKCDKFFDIIFLNL
jgi:hypothetical protein